MCRYPVLDADAIRCPKCGAVCEVTWARFPTADGDVLDMVPMAVRCKAGCWGADVVDGALERPDGCTGVSAAWCPIHGDCVCRFDHTGNRSLDDDRCPLHAFNSDHGEHEAL